MNTIEHSIKGSTWKKHKYIRKEGDRYIYDEKLENERKIDESIQRTENRIKDYKKRLKKQENREIAIKAFRIYADKEMSYAYDKYKDSRLSDDEKNHYKKIFEEYEEQLIGAEKMEKPLLKFMEINNERLSGLVGFLNNLKYRKQKEISSRQQKSRF